MPSVSRTGFVARKQAEKCIQKAEYYKTKSTAAYRVQAAEHCQAWAEIWSSIHEQLEELVQLRYRIESLEK